MKVLQLLPELNVGGVETGVVDLAVAMKAKGHEPHVISNGGALVPKLLQRDIPHLRLPVHKKNIIEMIRLVPVLVRYLRTHGIEIVHARSRVPAWIGYWACRITGTRFVTTCHGYYSTHMMSRVMAWGRLVIVPSNVIGRHMMESFGVPSERLRLIPRGVDLKRFKYHALSAQTPPTFRIGLIGRLTPLKGHVVLLRAAVRVVRAIPRVKILIVGEAAPGKEAYREELETWVRRLGLARSVEFVGSSQDVPGLLKELDLVVVPSVRPESFGRSVIEAQAAGVPVVASRIGGLAEIIEHEKTGLLVPPDDSEALAAAMLRVLTDRAVARKLVTMAREEVEAKYPLTQMVKATLSVYEELLRSTKILVIKLSAVGDVILASPSLRAIRAHYPHAHITCLVGSSSRPVVQRCPYVNEVFVDDASAHHKGYIGAWRLGRMLARHGFDVVFDLQSSRRSRLIGWSSGAAERHGYANTKWSFLLSHRVPNTEPHLPPVDHQFQLLEACGVRPMGDQLEYWHSDEDRQMITQFIKGQWMSTAQPMVALHPGASASWPTKQWSTNSWAALCDLLAKDHIRTVISGAPEDVALGEDILAMTRSKPIIAIGQTSLGSVAALFEQCQLVVTMDTAALHIAAAVSTPVVALFGPTDPRRHQPPGSAVHVLWKQVSCSPCYQRQCPLPDEQQMQCMQQIAVQDVFAAIQLHVRAAKDVSTEPVAPASHT